MRRPWVWPSGPETRSSSFPATMASLPSIWTPETWRMAEVYLAKSQEVCERAGIEPDALMILPFLS